MPLYVDDTNYSTMSFKATAPELDEPYNEYEETLRQIKNAVRVVMAGKNAASFRDGCNIDDLLDMISESFENCVREG